MIRCAELRPILSLFLEKETGPLETLETRRHLDGCEPCRLRARRLGDIMNACSELRENQPPADIAGGVMAKLRAMKQAAASAAGGALAARWSGLTLVVLAALAGITAPGSAMGRLLVRPFSFVAGLFGPGGGEAARDLAGAAVPVAMRFLNGDLHAELASSSGLDVLLMARLAATALALCFVLAIPVAALTYCLLRHGRTHRFSNLI
ncbi:MAG TPA: zf-HC2 domain-containing protein [Candidatus Polarisedimenticolia bacterium]|nr:zf-HC2 domain-containing protein [Candidatus Polarisedimenticolia bacterium]